MPDSLISCPKCGARYDGTRVRPGTKVRCTKCKAVFEAVTTQVSASRPQDALVGKTIGGFAVIEKIGVGGIGAVYKAKQLSLDRIVAFKTLKPEFAQNQSFISRLTREARASARITHANIVQTYDVGQDQGVSFIAMEFIEGETLQDKLTREGPIDVKYAVDVLEQAASALAFAHKGGIVHRDIKPDNLMIAKDGTIKVSDFGLAKRIDVDVSLTQSGTIVGTPRYMSPEQGNGEALDCRSDIYSLGASLYHALAGAPPFDAPTAMAVIVKHINDPLPPLRRQNPKIPPKLARAIERMMAKDPAGRYQTPDEVLAAIAEVKSTLAEDLMAVERGEVGPEEETVVLGPVDANARTAATGAMPAKSVRVRRRAWKVLAAAVFLFMLFVLAAAIKIGQHTKAVEDGIAEDFEARRARAQEFHNEDKFQEAINAFDGFPPEDAPNIEKWLEKTRTEKDNYLGLAKRKFDAEAAKAQEAAQSGDFLQARSIYQEIAQNFGVPSVLEEADQQLADVVKKHEAQISAQLSVLEKHLRVNPTDSGATQDLYSKIRMMKGDVPMSAEIERRIEALTAEIKKQRGGPKVLDVAQKGTGTYRRIEEAAKNVFRGDTIEIRDSEVYDTPPIVSHVQDVTIRAAAGCMPVIRPHRQKPPQTDDADTRMEKRRRFLEKVSPLGRIEPSIVVPGNWTLENLIIDLSTGSGGIHLLNGGELTLRSCSIINAEAYAIVVGTKLSGAQKAALSITDCVLAGAAPTRRPEPPRMLLLFWSPNQPIELEFSHNVVYQGTAFALRPMPDSKGKLVVHSNIFENLPTLAWSATPLLGVADMQFDYNCYSNRPNEYFVLEPMGLRRPPGGSQPEKQIVTFRDWQKAIGGDEHSMETDAKLVAPARGDFSLRANSPCLGKGKDKTNIGLLTARVLPDKLFAAPSDDKTPPRDGQPPPDTADHVRDKIDHLILDRQYDLAMKLIADSVGEPDVKQLRTESIEFIKELSELVTREINAGKAPPLPSSLTVDKYAPLAGGTIVAANDKAFTAADKNNENHTLIQWTSLTSDQFLKIAEKCTSIMNGREQLMLGLFCFEVGLTDKARTYLGYAKARNSTNISGADRIRAENLIKRIDRVGGKPPLGATPPPKSPTDSVDANREALDRLDTLLDEGPFNEALDQAEAIIKAHPQDTQLKYRIGFLLWERLQEKRKAKTRFAKEDYLRWWDMTWSLLRDALKEGGKLPGSQKAQDVIRQMEELSKGKEPKSKSGRREPEETENK